MTPTTCRESCSAGSRSATLNHAGRKPHHGNTRFVNIFRQVHVPPSALVKQLSCLARDLRRHVAMPRHNKDLANEAEAAIAVAVAGTAHATAPPLSSQHHTLKYSLLGPSLTKSGQDGVDQKKVSEIIYNASKGRYDLQRLTLIHLASNNKQQILQQRRKQG